MNFYQDNKSKLIEILKRDRDLFPDKREMIMEKIDKLNEKQIGILLRDIVDRHYDLKDIEEKIEEEMVDVGKKADKQKGKEVLEDFSRKGQIGAMRKVEEDAHKLDEEKMEIDNDDQN